MYYCERNELLICKMHQFGLGCIKNLHVDQSERGVCSISARRMFLFVAVVFGTFVSQTSVPNILQPKAMAERTRDGGVEECKGFSPPKVPTTSASSTRLPLGSFALNTRVPNTGTATPPRTRRTKPRKSADLTTKMARYAQRTERHYLMHDAHK